MFSEMVPWEVWMHSLPWNFGDLKSPEDHCWQIFTEDVK